MSGALAVRGLSKAYGGRQVLDTVDLEIPAGSLALIVGTNGAGKSTLLACLAGALRHEGEVFFGGRPLRPEPGRIAYLPQRLRLPSSATVGETLALFRALGGSQADRVAPPTGFVPDDRRRIGELSGGLAQRVALAGLLLGSPELLLLDEPFANLDDAARDTVSAMLREHQAHGATVVVASPAGGALIASADLVVRIESGAVAWRGTGRESLEHPEVDGRRPGWEAAVGKPTVAVLDDAGLAGQVRTERASASGR